ncbi:MAG: hypothetical protein A2289_21815 [Deltaproteobacteria bacterium RIFOXYA12_FULL_58_15]|nr:MAG: hypothetical protein A2289_21815 [Deltaproteobacteria bacterium RIFOXYA12_FULL_58_15]OGR11616.1 MAG: hypothetical protein A2341_02665 [Deltaproteobacteria bacterium RIFOXYB12_FULL_58_9]
METNTFTQGALTIEVDGTQERINVNLLGKSTARDPAAFILPILEQALQMSTDQRKPFHLDFCKTEYLNSSSITPVVRILERARKGSNRVTVHYDKSLRWQHLSFTALEVFQTVDDRIRIEGV